MVSARANDANKKSNDMPLHLNNSTTDIYADDTSLSLSANWNNITHK